MIGRRRSDFPLLQRVLELLERCICFGTLVPFTTFTFGLDRRTGSLLYFSLYIFQPLVFEDSMVRAEEFGDVVRVDSTFSVVIHSGTSCRDTSMNHSIFDNTFYFRALVIP